MGGPENGRCFGWEGSGFTCGELHAGRLPYPTSRSSRRHHRYHRLR